MKLKLVGKVVDAHGIKGEFKIKFLSSEVDWLDSLNSIIINDVSYELLSLRQNKTFWILKLANINDRNAAEAFKGMDIFADNSLFVTTEGEEPFLSELMGFDVEVEGRVRGQIIGFKETPAHFLLVLKTYNGFFEIPYVDNFIVEILRPDRKIKMNFPEDLLSEEYKLKESFDENSD